MSFLRSTTTNGELGAGWSSPHTRERFASTFDPEGAMTVAEFTAGPAALVELVDLGQLLSEVAD